MIDQMIDIAPALLQVDSSTRLVLLGIQERIVQHFSHVSAQAYVLLLSL